MSNDRRSQRSEAPEQAIRLFLDALVQRHGLDALSLVDEEGALVAGSTHPSAAHLDLAWIGTVASICAPGREPGASLRSLVDRATAGAGLDAKHLVVRGERLCIAAVGGRVPPSAVIVAGIERILGTALPAVA